MTDTNEATSLPDYVAQKAELRAKMNEVRNSLGETARARASKLACERLLELPEVDAAQVVTIFSDINNEISLATFFLEVAPDVVLLCSANVDKGIMEFIPVTREELLRPFDERPEFLTSPAKRLGVPEGREPVPAESIDLMIIPALAFDQRGYRLGYGGGYYDRYLKRIDATTPTIGICFDEQVLDEVPIGPYDQPVDVLITPTSTTRFSR